MLILAIMMLGVLIGLGFNLKKTLKVNGIIQMILTGILIFCMGVSLGNRENFFNELAELGWKSVIYMLVAVAFSVIFVYILTKLFLTARESRQENASGRSAEACSGKKSPKCDARFAARMPRAFLRKIKEDK